MNTILQRFQVPIDTAASPSSTTPSSSIESSGPPPPEADFYEFETLDYDEYYAGGRSSGTGGVSAEASAAAAPGSDVIESYEDLDRIDRPMEPLLTYDFKVGASFGKSKKATIVQQEEQQPIRIAIGSVGEPEMAYPDRQATSVGKTVSI